MDDANTLLTLDLTVAELALLMFGLTLATANMQAAQTLAAEHGNWNVRDEFTKMIDFANLLDARLEPVISQFDHIIGL